MYLNKFKNKKVFKIVARLSSGCDLCFC